MPLAPPSESYRRLVGQVEDAVDDTARLRVLRTEVAACGELSDDERDDLLTRGALYTAGCKPAPVEPYSAT
ncbi:MAG: hypothetical protein QOJ82_3746 [Solirubrobacteraceae bacterium]|jgi:hypothetical protein|nr:hypothetical protein [Solirubrobacteraceae bacterium]